jgi:hypothetical protein
MKILFSLSVQMTHLTCCHVTGLVAGPEAFGKGLVKGTQSLLKNTLTGVFGSASKFTDAVSSGMVKVGMDDRWERERRIEALKKPQHIGQGIKQGVVGLGKGLFHGVTGVVMQPVRGFQEEGAIGLVKGVGKGAAGLVLRPAVGVVDVFTKTAEGIQNMGKFLDSSGHRGRMRPPRSLRANGDKLLVAYDWITASADTAIREAKQGRYSDVTWDFRFTLSPSRDVTLQWVSAEILKMVDLFLYFFFPFQFVFVILENIFFVFVFILCSFLFFSNLMAERAVALFITRSVDICHRSSRRHKKYHRRYTPHKIIQNCLLFLI